MTDAGVAPGSAVRRGDNFRVALPGRDDQIKRRRLAIEEVVKHPPFTRERRAASQTSANILGVDRTTMDRYVRAFEAFGDNGLARKKPRTAGQPRVMISRAFDRHVDDPDQLEVFSHELDQLCKGWWKSAARNMGARKIARFVGQGLREVTMAAGLAVPEEAFDIPVKRVRRFEHYKVVDIRNSDRKRFSDNLPRIIREWRQYDPCEIVVADVKHLDLVMRRPDGSIAYPKMLAFLDAATGRAFARVVLLEPGEGIRQEHMADTFIAMASDPRWGICQQLLVDRGSENVCFELLRAPLNSLTATGTEAILKTWPYSPQSKPIEGWFGRFDAYGVALIPGYVGSDRLNKKTATQGKPTTPYNGAIDELRTVIADLVESFNAFPAGGEREGLSPEQAFGLKIDAGWTPTRVDTAELEAAFCTIKSRRIDRGRIKIRDTPYTHPQIYGSAVRSVEVALPWRRDAAPMFRHPGGDWLELHADLPFAALDLAGAREGALRRRAHSKAVAELDHDALDINPLEIVRKARIRPVPADPTEARPPLDLGQGVAELAGALSRRDEAAAPNAQTADQHQLRDVDELEARLALRRT